MAKGIGPGDAVICPAFTFTATAEVVALVGATPVFADVEEASFNLDPASLARAVAAARSARARAAGRSSRSICSASRRITTRIAAIADARRPVRARRRGAGVRRDLRQSPRSARSRPATATSFFPAKPLGCYGDGGAIFTDDDELAEIIRSLRMHGEGASQYDCVRIGMNGRLDTIQAAVLIEKLKIFPDEIAARDRIARRYSRRPRRCRDRSARSPRARPRSGRNTPSALAAGRRDELAAALKAQGIPTAIYYPKPLHRQAAYRALSRWPRAACR